MKASIGIIFSFLFVLVLSSCKKDDDKRESLFGSWNCEQYSDINPYKKYQVSISHSPIDSTIIVISNFHNLGIDQDVEVFVKKDSEGNLIIQEVLIRGTILIKGKGIVAEDFSEILWDYTVNNNILETVEARYY